MLDFNSKLCKKLNTCVNPRVKGPYCCTRNHLKIRVFSFNIVINYPHLMFFLLVKPIKYVLTSINQSKLLQKRSLGRSVNFHIFHMRFKNHNGNLLYFPWMRFFFFWVFIFYIIFYIFYLSISHYPTDCHIQTVI